MSERPTDPRRRNLLLAGLATVAGVGGAAGVTAYLDGQTPLATNEPSNGVRSQGGPMPRRRLGRTNLEVGVVGVGAGGVSDGEIFARAVELGMNYVDTAICYGDSELVLGRAFATRPGLREKVVLATKWDPAGDSPKSRILASLDQSLKRLQTDRIDVMQIHWLGSGHKGISGDGGRARLDNTALYEAMDEAKRAGKVRFFGATSHDAARSELLRYAIEKKVFDVLLVKMNVLDYDDADVPALLSAAKAADVGVVAMKSQPEGGAAPPGHDDKRFDAFQANLRWVLSKEIACVVHSSVATSRDAQELALAAAQQPLTPADTALLAPWAEAMSPHYCRGCEGNCHDACPDGVAIAPVLRARLYAKEYAWPEHAARLYARLPRERRVSDRCVTCSACTDACPWGVDAAERVREAAAIFGEPRERAFPRS
jgi:predicted aldo/keto reductase-like oxidoreductase